MDLNRQLDDIIDFKQFIFKIINNRYLFMLSLLVAILIAFLYNRYTPEVYKVETSILINNINTIENPTDLLYDKGIKNKNMSLENKELILKSYPLISSVLLDLNFDITYYIIGNIKTTETYIAPIKVICDNVDLVKRKSITIECLNIEEYTMIEGSGDSRIYRFGDEIMFHDTKLIIDLDPNSLSLNTAEFIQTLSAPILRS